MTVKLFIALVIILALYVQENDLIKFAQKHPEERPRKVLFDYFKNLFDDVTPDEEYPAYIGLDEYGNIDANNVNSIFQRFHEFFTVFCFVKHQDMESRVLYLFKADSTKIPMEEYDIWKACCGYCDDILHRYYHQNFPQSLFPENFFGVSVGNGNMTLSLAKNKAGAQENKAISERIRLFYESNTADKVGKIDDIHESWDDPK